MEPKKDQRFMEEKRVRDEKKQTKNLLPFYLAIAQGCLYLCIFLVVFGKHLRFLPWLKLLVICAIALTAIVPYFILGKFACTHRGGAIALVVLSTLMFAPLGLAGGIVGIVKNQKEKPVQPAEEEEHEPAETVDPAETGASSAETAAPVLEETAPVPKKKYKARLNFGSKSFVLAVVLWALSLCGFLLVPLSAAILLRYAPEAWLPLFLTGVILFFVAGDIAHLVLNYLDEKEPRTAVRVFWWLSLPPYVCTFSFIFMMIAAVGMLFKVITGNYESKPKGEKLFVVYDNGYERTLKRAEGSEIIAGTLFYRYVDDLGYYWLSADERTFYKK